MKLFDTIADMGHEQLVLCQDSASGYRGIIAIHSTVLGRPSAVRVSGITPAMKKPLWTRSGLHAA